ncbi:MAG: CPBP family intramembrane metalloprotease [Armatimonadetes bacterium]|nr:CPBP family intramembrane metalloprotease [Armatimonadota bacterium]
MEPINLDPKLMNVILAVMIALGTLVILSDMVIVIVWLFSKDREERGEPPLIAPAWSVAHAYFIAQIGFILANLFFLLVMAVGAFAFFKGSMMAALGSAAVMLVGLIGQNIILTSLPLALIAWIYRAPLYEIGLTLGHQPLHRLFRIGIVASIPVILLSALLEASMQYVAKMASFQSLKALQDAMSKMVGDLVSPGESLGLFILAFLVIGVIGPIGEEILFRGYIYTVLKKRFSVRAAVLGSAFLFAAVHGQPLALLPIFAIGVALALLYEYTGSLVPSMIVHMVNNSAIAIWMYFQLEKYIRF